MVTDFALEYIPRRMRELGHGDNYHLRWRHIQLLPFERQVISAYNQLYLIIDEPSFIQVESMNGMYEDTYSLLNEQVYEHTGRIVITNLVPEYNYLKIIQVIPIINS